MPSRALAAERFFAQPSRVGVAIGANFPDSLVAAPYLGATGQPLLLVDGGEALPPEIERYLGERSSGIGELTVFGGTETVQEHVIRSLRVALP